MIAQIIINNRSNIMGAPVVVQGTAVASPYDHTTAAPTDQPTRAAPRDPENVGEKQVSLFSSHN